MVLWSGLVGWCLTSDSTAKVICRQKLKKNRNITIVIKEKDNAQGWESIKIGETSSQNDLEVSPTQVGSFSCSGTGTDTTPY